jgi:hypothetical protein
MEKIKIHWDLTRLHFVDGDIMNRISMWDKPLIALLSIIKEKISNEDYDGAMHSIDSLIIRIEGWYEGNE